MNNFQNFEDALAKKLEKKREQIARKVKDSEFISLGHGTPFDLISTAELPYYTKHYLRQVLIGGEKEALQKYLKYRQLHSMDAQARRVEFDYAVSGDFVDVGRYMGGEPECMIDYAQAVTTQFVDFYINIDTCANVNEELSFAYYAAVISVIDSLENSNYRVRLTGVNYSDDIKKGKIYEVTTIIKDYNEPINYAYLTSICMARTAFFSAIMNRPGINLYNYCGCDYLPSFEPNITMQENTFYAPSLFGKNRHGEVYSRLNSKPEAFSFDSLIQDWKLAHLLTK